MGRRIVVMLVAMLAAATAFSATAAPVFFHMVGGICTDGSRDDHGSLLCSGQITVTIEMVDGYVPGTPFFASACCDTSPVVRFWYADRHETVNGLDFPTDPNALSGLGNSGLMSEVPGESYLGIHWYDGIFFDASADGTWFFGVESGGGNYFASGTSTDSVIGTVPEPATLALLGIGLVGLGFSRRRN